MFEKEVNNTIQEAIWYSTNKVGSLHKKIVRIK